MVQVLNSEIDSVQIYRQGAVVTRKLAVSVDDALAGVIQVNDLPLTLIDNSLKVWTAPSTGTEEQLPIASGVKISLQHVPEPEESPEHVALAEEIRKLQNMGAAAQERLNHVGSSIRLLDELEVPKRPVVKQLENYTNAPHALRLSFYEFVNQRRAILRKRYKELNDETRELSRQRQELVDKQENKSSVHRDRVMQHLRKSITVQLRYSNDDHAPCYVMISYQVQTAAWRPAYALRVQGEDHAELEMRALVAQNTGEDWSSVELTLSTAHLQQWCELPELTSLHIGRKVSAKAKSGYREPPQGAEALFANYKAFRKSLRSAPRRMSILEEVDMHRQAKEMAEPEAEAGYDDELQSVLDESYDDMEEMTVDAMPMDMDLMVAPAAAPMGAAGGGGDYMSLSDAEPPKQAMAKRSMHRRSGFGFSSKSASAGPAPAAPAPVMPPEPEFNINDQFLNFNDLSLGGLGNNSNGQLQYAKRLDYSCGSDERAAIDAACAKALPAYPEHYVSVQGNDGYDYAYACNSRVDVPSGEQFHSLTVAVQSAPVDMFFVAVPREGQEVYRMAHLKNPYENPLLQGPLDLYVNGEFFMSSKLAVVAPHGKMDIGLGVEEAIKVARNTTFNEETSGMLSGHLSLKHGIQIDVQNNLASEITLEVRERIPVIEEKEEELKVEIAHVEPAWKEINDWSRVRGRYQWDITVPAHEKQSLSVSYSLELSSKKEIVGGNRREG